MCPSHEASVCWIRLKQAPQGVARIPHLRPRHLADKTTGLGAPCAQWSAHGCRWVEEYHVDGFRFDLAACLCRDPHGTPLEAPPVIREISKDPVLSKVPPRGV